MVASDKDHLVCLAKPGDRLYRPVMSRLNTRDRPRLREVDTVTEENNIRVRSKPGLKKLEEEFVMSAEEVRMAAVPEVHIGEKEGWVFIPERYRMILESLFAQALVDGLRDVTHESHTLA